MTEKQAEELIRRLAYLQGQVLALGVSLYRPSAVTRVEAVHESLSQKVEDYSNKAFNEGLSDTLRVIAAL